MKQRLLPIIITLSALSISACAAYYSVFGLSKLFAGATTAIIIMASSLEVSKLVISSLLFQYWTGIPKFLKAYLTIATVVLIMITSMGIYGFLSNAYQTTKVGSQTTNLQIELVEEQLQSYKDRKQELKTSIQQTSEQITTLTQALGNNVVQWKDRETGQILTSTSSANRKAYQEQLQQSKDWLTELRNSVSSTDSSIIQLETQVTDLKIQAGQSSELGTLEYISDISGYPMDKVVNILILLIVIVFDPLAISLVLAANYGFSQVKKKPSEDVTIQTDSKPTIEEEKPVETLKKPVEPDPEPSNQTKSELTRREENFKKKLERGDNLSSYRKNRLRGDKGDDDEPHTYATW